MELKSRRDLIITMISEKFPFALRYSLIAGFFPLVALVLGADSLWFSEHNFGGQLLADSLSAVYLIALLRVLDSEEKANGNDFCAFFGSGGIYF